MITVVVANQIGKNGGSKMVGIKRVIGCVLIIVGVGLVGYYILGPADKRILANQADYGGISATSPSAKNKLYLFGGLACFLVGGGLVKKN